jgi:hypothetical protein
MTREQTMFSRAFITALCAASAVGFSSFPGVRAGDTAEQIKTDYYKGKVVPLTKAVEKFGVKLDADAAWLVLLSEDGKIYPLLKDDGARMFFKDDRLLNRPMRLTGRLLPGSQLLQVVEVHSYGPKHELREVYYWCDICTIERFENKLCDCCGAPMELREQPINK